MTIENITSVVTGLAGAVPRVVLIQTNDTVAEVTMTGYLNSAVENGIYSPEPTDIALVATSDAPPSWYTIEIAPSTVVTTNTYSLIPSVNTGDVLLPVEINRIATFTNIEGQIGDVATDATHGGNINAGMSGTAGLLKSFPPTLARGSLSVRAADNSGDFPISISNDTHGQSTQYFIPDVGSSMGHLLNTSTSFVNGNLIQAVGTAGKTIDSGLATTNVQHKDNIKAARDSIGGLGAGPIFVSVPGMTLTSIVVCTSNQTTNSVGIVEATASTDGFYVTFGADPGLLADLNYVVFIAPQV